MQRTQSVRRFVRHGEAVSTVQAIARQIAAPAAVRFLNSGPLFCRLITPLLLAMFLAVAAAAFVMNGRALDDAEARLRAGMSLTADVIAGRLDASYQRTGRYGSEALAQAALEEAVAGLPGPGGLMVLVTGASGRIVAGLPELAPYQNAGLIDVLGAAQPLTTFGARAGVFVATLPDGAEALVTVRHLAAPLGSVAVIGRRDALNAQWRADMALPNTVSVTFGIILLLLAIGFRRQTAELRQLQGVHETSRARLDTALRRGHCGMWDWDLARGRIFWSGSMSEMLGRNDRDAVLSVGDVARLLHPDDGDFYELAGTLADQSSGLIDRSFRMRHADGSWIWVRARAEIVPDAATGERHLVGIAVDITEQQRLAERSATADMRLRDAIEATSEAFVLWDAENRMVLCNRKYQELHGLPDPAVKPGIAYEMVMSLSRQPIVQVDEKANEAIDACGRVYEARIEDGRWLQISERRTKDGGFVSVGTDITALKQQEVRLLDNECQLLATVADLRRSRQTLELQAQQLVDLAQRYAEEKTRAEFANRSKSEFLANMSHELRTPLNAVIGFSEIMESGTFGPLGSEKYAEYCRDIRMSGEFLLDVINDILDMSRIEAGRYRLEAEELDLGEIADECVRIMSLRAQEKNISTSVDIGRDLNLTGDRRALKQVMLNLLSNAVKFNTENGAIKVRARSVSGGITISIEDTGIGIEKPAIRNLGRPFEQVENQFTRSHRGSGLGLAISRSLVELHGGALRIRSTPGKGTIVTVRLPQKPAAEPRPDDAADGASAAA